jgi:hypothetical protein
MIAWKKSNSAFEVYNVASEDWMTVDEVADEVIKAMCLGRREEGLQAFASWSRLAGGREEGGSEDR